MAKVLSLRQALKVWTAMILSAVLLYMGGELSDFLVAEPASTASRWLGAIVAAGSIVPWVFLIAWGVGAADEYHRQIALVGTALAFVLDLLVHVFFNVLQDARLVGWTSHLVELPTAIIVWMVGVAIAAVYYRLRL